VRRDLATLVRGSQRERPRILDAGGRRSPYTVGLSAAITILEMPSYGVDRDLGVTKATLAHLKRRRSNIEDTILESMIDCSLPSASFDGVVCVEVIEHVREDDRFVEQVARVLKPGGWAYFTTPNGDYIRNEPPHFNPEHVRHYRREELLEFLNSRFGKVDVRYGVKTGRNRVRGLRSLELKRPVRSMVTVGSNAMNWRESNGLEQQSQRTAHLFAVCWKRRDGVA
jgi:SAM-dependent methyltransferase